VSKAQLSSILGGVEKLSQVYSVGSERTGTQTISVEAVLAALNSFTDVVRYLNTRRSTGAILELSNEGSVQDALYLMLRPWILDLVPENPTDKIANRYAIKDFLSRSSRFVIEAKFVRSKDHGKTRSLNLFQPT
jgi:hypothetical protein